MSEIAKKRLLYALIFLSAASVLAVEPLSHAFGPDHDHASATPSAGAEHGH